MRMYGPMSGFRNTSMSPVKMGTGQVSSLATKHRQHFAICDHLPGHHEHAAFVKVFFNL